MYLQICLVSLNLNSLHNNSLATFKGQFALEMCTFYFLFFCVWWGYCSCHGTLVEIRGQHMRVTSVLLSCDFCEKYSIYQAYLQAPLLMKSYQHSHSYFKVQRKLSKCMGNCYSFHQFNNPCTFSLGTIFHHHLKGAWIDKFSFS